MSERETLAEAAAREFGFNPAEKRGEHGRWTHVGDVIKSMAGKESDAVGHRLDAHQRASDRRHAEHPNRLDRLAEKLGQRADAKADRQRAKKVAANLASDKVIIPKGQQRLQKRR
jgi:hypothetical protein